MEFIGQGRRDPVARIGAGEREPRSLYRFFLDLDLPTCSGGDCSDWYDLNVFDDDDDDEGGALVTVVGFPYHTIDRG